MSNDVKVKVDPTPIQRNKFDVAIELVKMHADRATVKADALDELFVRYYALAQYVEYKSLTDLQKAIPEELLKKIGEYSS